jgi:hypothetical protein
MNENQLEISGKISKHEYGANRDGRKMKQIWMGKRRKSDPGKQMEGEIF